MMTRGQLAKQAQVNVETIRYYEKERLMPKPSRSASGYRVYTAEDIGRLCFIKRAQSLGFALKEIAELLDLRVDPNTTCDDVKTRTQAKMIEIERKIQSLQKIKRVLSKLVASCDSRLPTPNCPILEALEKEEE